MFAVRIEVLSFVDVTFFQRLTVAFVAICLNHGTKRDIFRCEAGYRRDLDIICQFHLQISGLAFLVLGNGNKYTASQVAQRAGGSFNDSLYEVLRLAAGQGDAYSQAVLSELQNGYEFAPNTTGRSTGNAWYDTLGIVKTKDGRY